MRKTFSVLIIGVVVFTGVALSQPRNSGALSGSDFQAGRITDDSVFFNSGGMDVSAIQNFLNSKVPTCDTNGTKPYGGTTRAAYGTSKGHPPPYICLKDYRQDTPSRGAEAGLCNAYAGGNKSSTQIIYDVAQSCGISPRALIVLLEKEQSLVTDDWPWDTQYRSATGYGCPDTAPCDAEYYGFFNQVYSAARQFKRYARDANLFSYRAFRNNYIQYNPNASCGGSDVYIQNQATAGLYNYTPYQPNASALANLNGSGDSCGAYGNRNYWKLYNDWFGSTYGPSFAAQYVSQSSYPIINSGHSVSVYFHFRNTGTAFWKDDMSTFPGYPPIRMATSFPINRTSNFTASNWLNASRATGFFTKVYESDNTTLASDQRTVLPGQIARFEFTLYANPNLPPGVYREYFQPIAEGSPNWHMGGFAYLDVGIHKPDYRAAYHSQVAYPTVNKGGHADVFLQYKNIGNDAWFDDFSVPWGKQPIHLASSAPINRVSSFSATWPRANRPNLNFTRVYEADGTTFAANQHVVFPGQIARFEYRFSIPSNAATGSHIEYFQPIVEGAHGSTWNIGGLSWLQINVQ